MLIQSDLIQVKRMWGNFIQFTENEPSTVKLIHIKKGMATHLQYHNYRTEQWYVIKGKLFITKGIQTSFLLPGETITIDVKQQHRFEGLEDSIILEISKGYFDEKDIVHLD